MTSRHALENSNEIKKKLATELVDMIIEILIIDIEIDMDSITIKIKWLWSLIMSI